MSQGAAAAAAAGGSSSSSQPLPPGAAAAAAAGGEGEGVLPFSVVDPGESHILRPYWEYLCYLFR